jgi:hypothetical protein
LISTHSKQISLLVQDLKAAVISELVEGQGEDNEARLESSHRQVADLREVLMGRKFISNFLPIESAFLHFR